MYKKAIFRGIVLFFFFSFGVLLLLPPSTSFAQSPASRENNGLIKIKAENGLLSVKLENAQLTLVLQEIARQTGVQFVGWENAKGTVTQQFDNVPLDEGLKKISQSFIMVLKKTGEEGKPLRVEKVIIIAQKNPSSTSSSESTPSEPMTSEPSESSPSESTPNIKTESLPSPPPSPPVSDPVVQSSTDERPQVQVIQHPQKVEEPPKEIAQVSTPEPAAVQEEPSEPAVEDKPGSKDSKAEQKSNKKKKTATVKTASVQSSPSLDRARGEEAFKQKRWDMVVKYFGKYLEQNSSDQEIQEKVETAKKNASQAISLYQQGRKFEDEEDFKSANEYYKKTCDIYPEVFDAWERIKITQQKIAK